MVYSTEGNCIIFGYTIKRGESNIEKKNDIMI